MTRAEREMDPPAVSAADAAEATAPEAMERADARSVPLSEADLDHVAGGGSPHAAQGGAAMRRWRGA